MERSLNILKAIAQEVYSVVHPFLGTPESREVVGSGFGGDRTRFIDTVAEETIIQYLKRNHLSCMFVGEERGVQKVGEEPSFYLIVDGVDGTTNAIRGINFASTSLAVSPTDQLKDLEASVVMNLFNGGLYETVKGGGAYYKGKKIKPSEIRSLRDAVLSIDLSSAPELVEKVAPIMKAIKSLRSLGSAALEICYVASGLLDGYVDVRRKLRTLDIAAAMLILKEAGGVFLQPDGTELRNVLLTELNRFSVIAAANRAVYDEIVSLILKP
ncbi:MAG: inositol monophosphatase family protein [Nitrososphaerota archaeon]